MKKSLFIICLIASANILFAQTKKVVADKIIATVGDKIILKSEIDNSISDMQRQNIDVPANGKCLLLEQALGLKALVLQAEIDSIPVSDEDVDADIDNKIRYFINQYGSKEIVEQIAGKSLFQLKEDFRQTFKEQKLAQGERDKIVADVRITPQEVEAYYDSIPKDSLHFYESQLEVGEIVIYPKPSRDLENYAIDQLKEYKKEVEDGSKKFETLASLYTDDPGSKDNGGRYEINRNEKTWDPIFLAKAFSLKDGQISNVFKTKFGYHIIQMVSRNGDDAVIRHILKIPQISSIEVNQAKQQLDSVRSKLVAGTIDFGQAVSKYSEDENSKFTGGRIPARDQSTYLTIDELDKDLVLMLKDLKVGQYSQPTEFTDDRGKKAVRIVNILTKTEPHRENLKDDYDKVARRALEEKKNDVLEKWFAKKIPSFYVKISDDYKSCPEMQKWETNSTATSK
ncbi:peptidylprolyl isomerase [Ginsengibacter hankyongi]|uniref:Peptidylprolyl isomerase n=1 Tax=Ginsengibacter hankyongi TaxID=2607284 RepID=A0A5J5IPH5_9BACT|nr:peptidylprolyl isomerase [Ginsengibacter hankyongi]KAA9041917.1 peptidylprolyl isomerase [Ginsengibacter hankyongi]